MKGFAVLLILLFSLVSSANDFTTTIDDALLYQRPDIEWEYDETGSLQNPDDKMTYAEKCDMVLKPSKALEVACSEIGAL
jgi:hypothetical protein